MVERVGMRGNVVDYTLLASKGRGAEIKKEENDGKTWFRCWNHWEYFQWWAWQHWVQIEMTDSACGKAGIGNW